MVCRYYYLNNHYYLELQILDIAIMILELIPYHWYTTIVEETTFLIFFSQVSLRNVDNCFLTLSLCLTFELFPQKIRFVIMTSSKWNLVMLHLERLWTPQVMDGILTMVKVRCCEWFILYNIYNYNYNYMILYK